jgi:hypothetical protein
MRNADKENFFLDVTRDFRILNAIASHINHSNL